MKLHEAIASVDKCWKTHSFPDFEFVYEALCGSFIRREIGSISPVGMEDELREARLKLILLRYAVGDSSIADCVFQIGDAQNWDRLPYVHSSCSRAFYCLRDTNSSMITNGPNSIPKTYSFGPWFEPFRKHVERSVRAPFGLGFRRANVSICYEYDQPHVDQSSSPGGEVTEIKVSTMALLKRMDWLIEHATTSNYDQICLPASVVGMVAKRWKGNAVEIVSEGTRLLQHEAKFASEAFGYPVIDCMRCWDGGFTFTTIDDRKMILPDYFCWKIIDGVVHTVDLFNHAKPFVNYRSDDEITIDGHCVIDIKKSFESINGIDPETIGQELLPAFGFWQIVHSDGDLYCYPREAVGMAQELIGHSVKPLAEPVGVGMRYKMYRTLNIDAVKNHTFRIVS